MAADKQVVRIEVKAVIPTSAGCAVFLSDGQKTGNIHIDHSVGLAITKALQNEPWERPLTHDLIASILAGTGSRVDRVIINDFRAGVYYARLVLIAENELYERKIIEIDARPSDCIALACGARAPIYITAAVWKEMEDMTEMLDSLENQGGPFPDQSED